MSYLVIGVFAGLVGATGPFMLGLLWGRRMGHHEEREAQQLAEQRLANRRAAWRDARKQTPAPPQRDPWATQVMPAFPVDSTSTGEAHRLLDGLFDELGGR